MTNNLILELGGVQSEGDFHDRVTRAFDFPHYYGRNLDAFWDCITDFVEPTRVTVRGITTLPVHLCDFVARYVSMLYDYERETGGKFQVIVEELPTPNSLPSQAP